MTEYVGLSLQEIYVRKCADLHCKKNSSVLKLLPTKPDLFDMPTVIDLRNNFLGPKGLLPLLEVIRCCSNLMSIDLRDQQLSNESVEALCGALARHPTVMKLNLSNNPITIAAGVSLIELCTNNKVIETIVLDNTGLRPAVINAINASLGRNKAAKQPKATESIVAAPTEVGNTDKMRVMDLSVIRTTLLSFPSSLNSLLFDENPVGALTALCQKFDALFYDTQFSPEPQSVCRGATGMTMYEEKEWQRFLRLRPDAKLFPEQNPIPLPRNVRTSFSWIFSCMFACLPDDDIRQLVSPAGVNPYGVYTVKFFIDGKWRYVVVDDYLPVSIDGSLTFAGAANDCFFYSCIIEKAVAKMHGGYHALDLSASSRHPAEKRCSCATLMCDFCAGVGISRDLHHEEFKADEWWNTLLNLSSSTSTSLVAVSAEAHNAADPPSPMERSSTITPSHAYQMLRVVSINGFKLIHLFSRWCLVQWNGEWGDKSIMWEQNPQVAASLDFANKGPRSFWMPYSKFLQHFASVHLCRPFSGMYSRILESQWSRETAGGPYFGHTWWSNPRFKFTLTARAPVFVNIALPDSRFSTSDTETLAFHIFRSDYFPIRFEKENIAARTSYIIVNSVSFDGLLDAGVYYIIPSTYTRGTMGKFYVRVFAPSGFLLREEELRAHWTERVFNHYLESSGEYQNGEDNPQYAVKIAPSDEPSRLVVNLHSPESEKLSLILFLCQSPHPGRLLGSIPEECIVSKSKFVISNSVFLEAKIPCTTETNYVVVPCIAPEKTATPIVLKFWCSNPNSVIEELPLWKKKYVQGDWFASGPYQEATRNPQFELIAPLPNQTFMIRMSVTRCSDPSIIFFVINNKGRCGQPICGRIADERIVCKSTYIHHNTVMQVFDCGPNPSDSYLIIPCLQPTGSKGFCTLTVSCISEDFQLHNVASAS